ncbi:MULTISPECIES: ABC transporter ATP-binding protein [unclassified Paenibacillus]|uniref:ABC transporter ATP-binding protein n=1 Tax=unclassified Paenibacillus TaxID=185978 RepID=UPI002F409BC6
MISISSEEVLLQAVAVSRTYRSGAIEVEALKNANLSVRPGQLVALKGRSGSGKTTLLNILAALDDPTSGEVYYRQQSIKKLTSTQRDVLRSKEIGLVFQSFALVPYMTAYENVDFGLRVAGVPAAERKIEARQSLEFVGLKQRMHHYPQELSGGEQQRVAIARAIAHKPKLLLADEPTAELDTRMGIQVMNVFKQLAHKEGLGIILTTHDPNMMDIVDVVYELEDGSIVNHAS